MAENTSPSPNSAPSVDALKTLTESLAGLAQWIAKLILEKNWFTLLLLVDVGLLFGFNPEGGIILALFKQFFGFGLPSWYGNVFWIVLGGIFLAAIAVAVKTMPHPGKVEVKEGEERKVIKGLRSFTVEDAEIFAQLQRGQSIETCLQSLKSQEFRFGVLMGESGCGKSSLLQAGLLPKLNEAGSAYRAIYIKFTERSPLETVQQALLETLATVPNVN